MLTHKTCRPPLFVLAAVLAATACARGPDPLGRMIELNRQAIALYELRKYDDAKARLTEAVVTGKEGGLGRDNMMARTYLNLGSVHIATGDRDEGVQQMTLGLRLRSDVPLTPQLASPAVKRAYAAARIEARKKAKEPAAALQPIARAKPADKSPTAPPPTAPPPTAPPRSVPASPPEPAAPSEPELPATFASVLACPTPDEAAPNTDLLIRCALKPGLKASRVTVHYRAPGSEAFIELPMTRSPKGWYLATIPATATTGKSMQFYVDAETAGRKPLAMNGQLDSPNQVFLLGAGAGAGAGARLASGNEPDPASDNPLDLVDRERELATLHRREPGHLWVGFGLGSGYGWHLKRYLQLHKMSYVQAGFSSGVLVDFLPEVGYQWDERLSLSVQGRHQYTPEAGSGDPVAGAPPHWATSILLRAHYALTGGNTQWFATGSVGGGQGFHLYVPPRPNLPKSDVINAGPIVLGPGAGLMHHFSSTLALAIEVRLLIGLPNTAAVADLDLGLQYSF